MKRYCRCWILVHLLPSWMWCQCLCSSASTLRSPQSVGVALVVWRVILRAPLIYSHLHSSDSVQDEQMENCLFLLRRSLAFAISFKLRNRIYPELQIRALILSYLCLALGQTLGLWMLICSSEIVGKACAQLPWFINTTIFWVSFD